MLQHAVHVINSNVEKGPIVPSSGRKHMHSEKDISCIPDNGFCVASPSLSLAQIGIIDMNISVYLETIEYIKTTMVA